MLLHGVGDPIVPIEYARETAALLPNAQLIEYETNDHFAFAGRLGGRRAPAAAGGGGSFGTCVTGQE